VKQHSWAVNLLALTAPIILSGFSIFWLGWPVRFPYPAAHFVFLFSLALTVFIGFKWRKGTFSAFTLAVANRAFIGSAIGTFILGLVFLTPSVVQECATVYYDYHIPAIDNLVEKLANKLDNGGC
jgi:hypothetical protein